MLFQPQIIIDSDIDDILQFAPQFLEGEGMQKEMAAWNARWRREALEHYAPLGWSFLIRDDDQKIRGFFLAQPLLFFNGHTQALWVEEVLAESDDIRSTLVETAYKLAREKHLQRLIIVPLNEVRQIVSEEKITPIDSIQVATVKI